MPRRGAGDHRHDAITVVHIHMSMVQIKQAERSDTWTACTRVGDALPGWVRTRPGPLCGGPARGEPSARCAAVRSR